MPFKVHATREARVPHYRAVPRLAEVSVARGVVLLGTNRVWVGRAVGVVRSFTREVAVATARIEIVGNGDGAATLGITVAAERTLAGVFREGVEGRFAGVGILARPVEAPTAGAAVGERFAEAELAIEIVPIDGGRWAVIDGAFPPPGVAISSRRGPLLTDDRCAGACPSSGSGVDVLALVETITTVPAGRDPTIAPL